MAWIHGATGGPVSLVAGQLACVLFAVGHQRAAAQLSTPIADNGHVSVAGNIFLERQASHDPARSGNDEQAFETCPQNVQLNWMAEATSSIYATPIITDLYADGFKDIIVPSFVHNLEAFQGDNGAQAAGFPAVYRGKAHASPLLFDVDSDGIQEIVMATYEGEVLFFRDTGKRLPERLTVPKLTVKRDWFVGLNKDHVDHSSTDVPVDGAESGTLGQAINVEGLQAHIAEHHEALQNADSLGGGAGGAGSDQGGLGQQAQGQQADATAAGRGTLGVPGAQQGAGVDAAHQGQGLGRQGLDTHEANIGSKPRLNPTQRDIAQAFREDNRHLYRDGDVHEADVQGTGQQAFNPQQRDSAQRFQDQNQQLFQDTDTREQIADRLRAPPRFDPDGNEARPLSRGLLQAGDAVEADPDGDPSQEGIDATVRLEQDGYDEAGYADEGWVGQEYEDEEEAVIDGEHHLRDDPDLRAKYQQYLHDDLYDYGHYHSDGAWSDLDYLGFQHDVPVQQRPEYVRIDAHVMCTPAVGDIDGDGNEDLVVPVSYLFDRAYYDSEDHRSELPLDLDISMYLASGVVVYDLVTHTIKMSAHLDLSTDKVDYRAYVYSSPTLADLDHDGKLEIIIGTSVGFVYVLDHIGRVKPGWPVQMGEVQGQVAVADVNGDGWLELVAVDTRGSIGVFNATGSLLWDRHLRSALSQMPTLGDINGDGRLEVVVGSGGGQIFALDAQTGEPVPNFPFKTSGRVVAPITITRLVDGPAQQLLVLSFDGFLYIIDGISGCADVVDIGDTSYTSVLVDDLDNNGKLDLLVTTMSGHLYAFETPSDYHPLKTWTAQVPGGSNFVARHDWMGVYATALSRAPRDIRGTFFPVEIEIIDKTPPALARANDGDTAATAGAAEYRIKATLTNIDTASMNDGDAPVIGISDTFTTPGTHTLSLPCPKSRATAVVKIALSDQNGVTFVHEFAQSFHIHFDKLLKWLVAAPLLAMGFFLLVLKPYEADVLPM